MAVAVDTRREVVFAAKVAGRSSATFLRLSAFAADAMPDPGPYAGCIGTVAGSAPCAMRVLDDRVSVWCQPRGPLPPPAVGQVVWVTVLPDQGDRR